MWKQLWLMPTLTGLAESPTKIERRLVSTLSCLTTEARNFALEGTGDFFPQSFACCSQSTWKVLWKLQHYYDGTREPGREKLGGKYRKSMGGAAGSPCLLALAFILHIFLSWILASAQGLWPSRVLSFTLSHFSPQPAARAWRMSLRSSQSHLASPLHCLCLAGEHSSVNIRGEEKE